MTPREFLEAYQDTWTAIIQKTAEVERLSTFFHLPCLMLLADKSVESVAEPEALLAFNRERVASFQAGGAWTAKLLETTVTHPGGDVAFASVRWQLKRSDGSEERAWLHDYTLRKAEPEWQILVSAFRVGA